jgi:ADP-ribosyl-[dinitrogen reductase] hydrolase
MDSNIYYTFLAGWCAESAGARIEFCKKRFNETEVYDAMHMVGQNTSGVQVGQITDDSEMEISLLKALISSKNDEYFPLETIAKEYIEWYKSEPFDIGQSTTYALLDATDASDMLTNAYEFNYNSESNGSLMRSIPLAVFGINKTPETIMQMAKLDSELTHPKEIVGEITGLYCVIISQILNKVQITSILETLYKLITKETIIEWINIGKELTTLNNYDCIKNEGHMKHAFIFIIYFLFNIEKYTYEMAISEVLECGGDTDTNAKIVGNLFGAYYGDCVPSYMSENVLNFDCTDVEDKYYKRPYKYGVHYAIQLIKKLPIV